MQTAYIPRKREKRERKDTRRKRLTRLILLIGTVFCIYLFLEHVFIPKNTTAVEGAAVTPLGKVVEQTLASAQGTYGIVIKNLKTGEAFALNEHTVFDSASLYKLWVMGTVYEQIQEGNLQETTMLSEPVSRLNKELRLTSETALLTTGKVALPVRGALQQMVTISDNYDAELLTDKVGVNRIAAFLQSNDLPESSVGENGTLPTTTAADIASFFEKLYTGNLANKTYTSEMTDLLKQQQVNTKLPSKLPDTVVVAHKTGELDAYSHDAGIVYTPFENYIIVILTKSDDPSAAEDTIANVSVAVYKYFTTE